MKTLKLKKIVAVAVAAVGLAAGAATVEITSMKQTTPGSGTVDVTYNVSGLGSATADLTLKVCAGDKTANVTVASVADGTGTKTINYTELLGSAYPNVSVVASLPETALGGVQLWANGPYWAECNVGASNPEDCGYYFYWGDTVGFKRVGSQWNALDGSTNNFSFGSASAPTYRMDITALKNGGYIDGTGKLTRGYDAATAYLGGPWRMPTKAEFDALKSNCTATWTTQNGVNGYKVTGKATGYTNKSIFLPAAGYGFGSSNLTDSGSRGYYWSSTPSSDYSGNAWYLYFNSSYFDANYYNLGRYYGIPVRPVRGFAE